MVSFNKVQLPGLIFSEYFNDVIKTSGFYPEVLKDILNYLGYFGDEELLQSPRYQETIIESI